MTKDTIQSFHCAPSADPEVTDVDTPVSTALWGQAPTHSASSTSSCHPSKQQDIEDVIYVSRNRQDQLLHIFQAVPSVPNMPFPDGLKFGEFLVLAFQGLPSSLFTQVKRQILSSSILWSSKCRTLALYQLPIQQQHQQLLFALVPGLSIHHAASSPKIKQPKPAAVPSAVFQWFSASDCWPDWCIFFVSAICCT